MKKKFIWITLASILGIFAMILFVVIFTGRISVGFDKDGKFQVVINSGKGDLSTLDQIVLAMNNTHKTDVFVLGPDCHFRKDVAVKNIDSITETSVAPGADSEFHLIVINDMNGDISLSEEEYLTINKLVVEGDYALFYVGDSLTINKLVVEGDYALFYVGDSLNNEFASHNITKCAFEPGHYSFSLRHYRGTIIQSSGDWVEESILIYEENPEILGEIILYFVYDIIRGV